MLADIGMPKRSGYDVAAFVKGHPELTHIPVLLLAGAFEPVDEARAEQVGCDGVLVKPFEPQHVIARVRELLDGVKGSPTQARRRRPSHAPAPQRSEPRNRRSRAADCPDRLRQPASAKRAEADRGAPTSIDDGDFEPARCRRSRRGR